MASWLYKGDVLYLYPITIHNIRNELKRKKTTLNVDIYLFFKLLDLNHLWKILILKYFFIYVMFLFLYYICLITIVNHFQY
jgi:hypothetical protein